MYWNRIIERAGKLRKMVIGWWMEDWTCECIRTFLPLLLTTTATSAAATELGTDNLHVISTEVVNATIPVTTAAFVTSTTIRGAIQGRQYSTSRDDCHRRCTTAKAHSNAKMHDWTSSFKFQLPINRLLRLGLHGPHRLRLSRLPLPPSPPLPPHFK